MARKDAMKIAAKNVAAHKAAETKVVTGTCRKCGVGIEDQAFLGSISPDGKLTCQSCLPTTDKVQIVKDETGHATIIPAAANAPVKVDDKNTTAKADPTKAPKVLDTAAPVAVKADDGKVETKRDKANKAAVKAEDAEAATALWTKVTTMAKDGVERPKIAEACGVTYSRVTFVLWHLKYGVNAIPGMPEYTQAAKDAAQKKYEADVAAKKANKND